MMHTEMAMPVRLEKTIRVLCPIIEKQIQNSPQSRWNEYALRRELVACILGSQVRYEMAELALSRVENAGLLKDNWWKMQQALEFEGLMLDVLSQGYRFPKARARQLAGVRESLACEPLSERLRNASDAKSLRQSLVADLPGIGPKQASMFLRNIGHSHDLAVLDTHVLQYLEMQELIAQKQINIGSVSAYERTELVATGYASTIGYPVGYLDWAIWATMKAARELRL